MQIVPEVGHDTVRLRVPFLMDDGGTGGGGGRMAHWIAEETDIRAAFEGTYADKSKTNNYDMA